MEHQKIIVSVFRCAFNRHTHTHEIPSVNSVHLHLTEAGCQISARRWENRPQLQNAWTRIVELTCSSCKCDVHKGPTRNGVHCNSVHPSDFLLSATICSAVLLEKKKKKKNIEHSGVSPPAFSCNIKRANYPRQISNVQWRWRTGEAIFYPFSCFLFISCFHALNCQSINSGPIVLRCWHKLEGVKNGDALFHVKHIHLFNNVGIGGGRESVKSGAAL